MPPESLRHKELKKLTIRSLNKLGFKDISEEVSICFGNKDTKGRRKVTFRIDIIVNNLKEDMIMIECGNIKEEKIRWLPKIVHIPYGSSPLKILKEAVEKREKKDEN